MVERKGRTSMRFGLRRSLWLCRRRLNISPHYLVLLLTVTCTTLLVIALAQNPRGLVQVKLAEWIVRTLLS